MIFSTNQNRQFYFLKTKKTSPADVKNLGDFYVYTSSDKKYGYVVVKGADAKTTLKTDKIENVSYFKSSRADSMAIKKKYVTIALADSDPIPGQDYIMQINFTQAFGKADDHVYQTFGAVHTFAGMTASKFYAQMIVSLYMNLSRELDPMVKLYYTTSDGNVEVTPEIFRTLKNAKAAANLEGATGIVVKENIDLDHFEVGVTSIEPVFFTCTQSKIEKDSDEVDGLVISDPIEDGADVVNNGYIIAEMEYFYMGERGDQYRKNAFPNKINTKLCIDPTKKYDTLDAHFAYVGEGTSPQKSEKDIIFVAEAGTSAINTIFSANTDGNILKMLNDIA